MQYKFVAFGHPCQRPFINGKNVTTSRIEAVAESTEDGAELTVIRNLLEGTCDSSLQKEFAKTVKQAANEFVKQNPEFKLSRVGRIAKKDKKWST